jgi:hypothetical protein
LPRLRRGRGGGRRAPRLQVAGGARLGGARPLCAALWQARPVGFAAPHGLASTRRVPRRCAPARSMAQCGPRNPIDVLPPAVVRVIFLRLPADQRARAACVSSTWRTAMADPALWLRLDLSSGSGLTCRVDGDAVRTATARVRGGLVALNVAHSRLYPLAQKDWLAVLNSVVAANAASLRELRLSRVSELAELQTLLHAAPALQAVEAEVWCDCTTALRVLRNEPPFGPMRMRRCTSTTVANEAETLLR